MHNVTERCIEGRLDHFCTNWLWAMTYAFKTCGRENNWKFGEIGLLKLKDLKFCKLEFCEHCIVGKQTKVKFGNAIHYTKWILDYAHTIVWEYIWSVDTMWWTIVSSRWSFLLRFFFFVVKICWQKWFKTYCLWNCGLCLTWSSKQVVIVVVKCLWYYSTN